MDKFSILTRLQEIYSKNENIIAYLKQLENRHDNALEDIMISYDLQAGSYVEKYKKNPDFANRFVEKISDFIIQKNIGGGGIGSWCWRSNYIMSFIKEDKRTI